MSLIRHCLAAAFAVAVSAAPVASAIAAEPPAAVNAASAQGIWKGTLEVMGRRIPLEFKLDRGADGAWTGTFTQIGAATLPFDRVTVTDGKVVAELTRAGATFEGVLDPQGNQLKGQWKQHGLTLDLAMDREAEATVVRRPQDPVPPFPYTEREVSYTNPKSGFKLAGTLTVPPGAGPFPTVLLITGSGAQDRDETLLGHKPFRVLADAFARKGVAVLRVDDRGMGGSGGSTPDSTTLDFATDVAAGLDFLKTQREVDPKRVGLAGHSEGGLIAPIVASERLDVAFICLLAGPGVTGDAIIRMQSDAMRRGIKMSDADMKAEREFQGKLLAIAESSVSKEEGVLQAMALYSTKLMPGDSPEAQAQRAAVKSEVEWMMSPWYRAFLKVNPAPYLAKVTCPILSLNGEKDVQVPYEANQGEIARAVKSGKNAPLTIRHFPDLNHLFQTSKTGLPSEYQTIEETFAPVALNALTDWVVQVAKR